MGKVTFLIQGLNKCQDLTVGSIECHRLESSQICPSLVEILKTVDYGPIDSLTEQHSPVLLQAALFALLSHSLLWWDGKSGIGLSHSNLFSGESEWLSHCIAEGWSLIAEYVDSFDSWIIVCPCDVPFGAALDDWFELCKLPSVIYRSKWKWEN